MIDTYHIYKTDCYKSSRVVLQASWDASSFFVHPLNNVRSGDSLKDGVDIDLTFFNLLKLILALKGRRRSSLVFHAQSSLPYLFFVKFLLFFVDVVNVRIVYDIHDFHERPHVKRLWGWFRYSVVRYSVLLFLEWLVLHCRSIKVMAVSGGLSQIVSEQYKCRPPAVVMSAPRLEVETIALDFSEEFSVVYFGMRKHAPPTELVKQFVALGIPFHLYGRDIPEGFYDLEDPRGVVKYFGEYNPKDLSFLKKYKCLVLHKQEANSLNYRVALPNKMFQAISFGLCFILSSNFEEMIETLRGIPGSIYVLDDLRNAGEAIKFFQEYRGKSYHNDILTLSRMLSDKSQCQYLRLTQGK